MIYGIGIIVIVLMILSCVPYIGGGSSQSTPTEKYEIDWALMNKDSILYGERYVKEQKARGKYYKYKE